MCFYMRLKPGHKTETGRDSLLYRRRDEERMNGRVKTGVGASNTSTHC